MSHRVFEVQTAYLLNNHCVRVADSCLLEVKDVTIPRYVCLLDEEFGVHGECLVGHAVHVHQLRMDDEKLTEVGLPRLELKIPYLYSVFKAELLRADL